MPFVTGLLLLALYVVDKLCGREGQTMKQRMMERESESEKDDACLS